MDAFFLVYFSDYKRMVKYDVDLFLAVLAEGRKHLKITEGEEWDYKKCLEVKIHEKEIRIATVDRCVMCGEIIPEGKQVCGKCKYKTGLEETNQL